MLYGAIFARIYRALQERNYHAFVPLLFLTFFLLECDVLRILRSIMRHNYDFDSNNDDDNDNNDDGEEGVLTKT